MSVYGLDEAKQLARASWGDAAVAALDAHARSGDVAELHVERAGPCAWLRATDDTMPPSSTPLVYEAGAWHPCGGVDGWSRILVASNVDVTTPEGAAAALDAFDRIAHGCVLRSEVDARALTAPPTREHADWAQPPVPADADAVRAFEPPHREGRAFVFQANVLFDAALRESAPAVVRVVVDGETTAVSLTRLCKGRNEGFPHYLVGRALVDEGGALVRAPLVVARRRGSPP